MLKLIKPLLQHKNKYKEMICEWQQYGGPYVPCIIEYDCGNPVDELDYDALLKVVDDYSKGNVFDYDVDYFESYYYKEISSVCIYYYIILILLKNKYLFLKRIIYE